MGGHERHHLPMRLILVAALALILPTPSACVDTHCFCEGPGYANVWPSDDQVLAVFEVGRFWVTASAADIELTSVTLSSEPADAFELVFDDGVPTRDRPALVTPEQPFAIVVRLSKSHPVREPASASLRVVVGGGAPIVRTVRLEPPTPHLDVMVAPRLPNCVDEGEVGIQDVVLANIGSADATVSGFEAIDPDPGYTLWVGDRSFEFEDLVQLVPPIVIAPGASAEARIQYQSTGTQRADAWLRVQGDAANLSRQGGGGDVAFNVSCYADLALLPNFGSVAVGEEKTFNATLTPRQGATFFRFSDLKVRDEDGDGPAAGFAIAPEAIPDAGIYRDTLIIPVTFRPDRVGPFAASLLACANEGCGGYTIMGTGTPAP